MAHSAQSRTLNRRCSKLLTNAHICVHSDGCELGKEKAKDYKCYPERHRLSAVQFVLRTRWLQEEYTRCSLNPRPFGRRKVHDAIRASGGPSWLSRNQNCSKRIVEQNEHGGIRTAGT